MDFCGHCLVRLQLDLDLWDEGLSSDCTLEEASRDCWTGSILMVDSACADFISCLIVA